MTPEDMRKYTNSAEFRQLLENYRRASLWKAKQERYAIIEALVRLVEKEGPMKGP